MGISSINSSASYSLAPLRAANKQPELALELINRMVQGIQEAGAGAQGGAVQTPVQPVSSSSYVGQNIDVYG